MRSFIAATLLAVSTLIAVPAFAAPGAGTEGGSPSSARVERGPHQKVAFPIPGAAFKGKIDARIAKARERMEKRVSKLTPDRANVVRARFDAGTAKVNEEVNKAIADGTVTKVEAKQVRKTVRQITPHRRCGHDRQKAGNTK